MAETQQSPLFMSSGKPHETCHVDVHIGYTRTCSCPPHHLNCLSAKEWIKYQMGVWQFAYEGRDLRDKNLHPATFPIALAKRVISLFTHEGELVLIHS